MHLPLIQNALNYERVLNDKTLSMQERTICLHDSEKTPYLFCTHMAWLCVVCVYVSVHESRFSMCGARM